MLPVSLNFYYCGGKYSEVKISFFYCSILCLTRLARAVARLVGMDVPMYCVSIRISYSSTIPCIFSHNFGPYLKGIYSDFGWVNFCIKYDSISRSTFLLKLLERAAFCGLINCATCRFVEMFYCLHMISAFSATLVLNFLLLVLSRRLLNCV